MMMMMMIKIDLAVGGGRLRVNWKGNKELADANANGEDPEWDDDGQSSNLSYCRRPGWGGT